MCISDEWMQLHRCQLHNGPRNKVRVNESSILCVVKREFVSWVDLYSGVVLMCRFLL